MLKMFSRPWSNPALLGGPGSKFPLLRLYYKDATFEPELWEYVFCTTAILQSCDFRAGAPGERFSENEAGAPDAKSGFSRGTHLVLGRGGG